MNTLNSFITLLIFPAGTALILTGMVPRTTKDLDIVALARSGVLRSPDPLPVEADWICRHR